MSTNNLSDNKTKNKKNLQYKVHEEYKKINNMLNLTVFLEVHTDYSKYD